MENKEKIEILESARKLLHKEGYYRISYTLLDIIDEYADCNSSQVEKPVINFLAEGE